jgi:nicotinate-nucleotide pyrophosphorylase (carboxylating)
MRMNQMDYRTRDRIKEFLDEDIGYGDITSSTLIPEEQRAKGKLYFKEPGVASGLVEAAIVFEVLGCKVTAHSKDGEEVEKRQVLLTVNGPARSLLMGERLALNIVGRMAGIATHTTKVVNAVKEKNIKTRVAATRKTLPGLREFDKRAVEHGGGDPHRFRLDDCVLIKDNHLELVPSITEAVRRARDGISFTKMVEIEVRSLAGAEEAARAGADIIMLDNIAPPMIEEWLGELDRKGLREGFIYEASGGITFDNAADYAAAGVDIISLGALTHSVRSLDVKFEIEMMK